MGGFLGAPTAKLLSNHKGGLTTVFAMMIFAVALYMLARSVNLI